MISRVLQKGSTWLINSSLVTITSGANPVCGAVNGGWADAAARGIQWRAASRLIFQNKLAHSQFQE